MTDRTALYFAAIAGNANHALLLKADGACSEKLGSISKSTFRFAIANGYSGVVCHGFPPDNGKPKH